MNLNQLKQKAATVSNKVFGPQRPPTSPVRKMVEETEELLESLMVGEDPSEEFADVFLLLVDAFRMHFGDDVDMQKLIDDSSKKLDVVAKRVWGKPDEYGVFKHIKDDVESWNDGGVSTGLNSDEIPPLKLQDDELPWEKDDRTEEDIQELKDIASSVTAPSEIDEERIKKDMKKIGEIAPKITNAFDVDLIQRAYDDVVVNVAFQQTDEITRDKIKELMEERLPSFFEVKCDEENNPPSVQDSGNIWARVTDKHTDQYIDVVF